MKLNHKPAIQIDADHGIGKNSATHKTMVTTESTGR